MFGKVDLPFGFSLVHEEGIGHVVNEPLALNHSPRDVTIPWSNNPVRNSRRSKLFVNKLGLLQWASVVEEAYVHRDLHLLHQPEVHKIRLWVLVWEAFKLKPVRSVLLETTRR